MFNGNLAEVYFWLKKKKKKKKKPRIDMLFKSESCGPQINRHKIRQEQTVFQKINRRNSVFGQWFVKW